MMWELVAELAAAEREVVERIMNREPWEPDPRDRAWAAAMADEQDNEPEERLDERAREAAWLDSVGA